MLNPLERAATLVTQHVEPVADVELLSDTRNEIVRVRGNSGRDYAVKLYRPASDADGTNVESIMYRCLAGVPGVKRHFAASTDFLITEHVTGEVLSGIVATQRIDADMVGSRIVEFVRACSRIECAGHGEPDAELRGTSPSWATYLNDYLDRIGHRIGTLPPRLAAGLGATHQVLRDYLDAQFAELDAVESVVVPVDLNLANFVLTEDDHIVALDLKTFWLADPLLALGEWTAHTYGTPVHRAACRAWGALTGEQIKRVSFYALLATLDIEVFIAGVSPEVDPDTIPPWGHSVTFGELASMHRNALDRHDLSFDEFLHPW